MTSRFRFHALAAPLTPEPGAPLPSEFPIFVAGLNETEKGSFMFDAKAAQSVLAEYEKRGVDLMIDLEHDSLSADARLLRSDAADARGWFQLEVHPDGSLWAVNVTWATDGEARLRDKRQRYISPAFQTEIDSKGVERPVRVVNAAICARPATFDTPALVAASAPTLRFADRRAIDLRVAGYIQKVKRTHPNGSR